MSSGVSRALGGTSPWAGKPGSEVPGEGPIDGGVGLSSSDTRPFYALSPVLQVGTPALSVGDSSASEAAGTLDFEVTLAPASTQAVTVQYATAGGTATQGTDYSAASGTLTFAAGVTRQTISVPVTDDMLHEGDEQFVLSLTSPTGGATLEGGVTNLSATGTIADNEMAPTGITLGLNPDSVREDGEAQMVDVTVALVGTLRGTATEVTVSQTGGTATSGTDYLAMRSFTVTIPALQTSGTATLTFTPTDDNTNEGPETVELTATATGLDAGEATLTITDDDSPSTAIDLSLDRDSVAENAAAMGITVTAALNGAARTTATAVTVSRTGGTADSGTDYAAITDFTVTIPANQPSATATLTFTPTDDSVHEGDETVVLTGSATGLAGGTATLTITDDDAAPTGIALSLDPDSIAEDAGATPVTVTATLVGSAVMTATTVTVSQTGGTATSGTDFVAVSSFTVTIPANQTSGTATLTFTPTDDNRVDAGETVVLTGSATGLTSGTATLTITDDDVASTAIELSLDPDSVAEDAAATAIEVTAALNAAVRTTTTTVTVSRTGGTATSGTDYAAITDFTVTIPANQLSGTATLTFTPTDDSVHEGSETVVLTGSVTGLTSGMATLTIADDDDAPTGIELSLDPDSVAEDAAATPISVTAALVGSPVATATTVTVSRTGGSASSGTDYAAVSNFTVTIAARRTSGTATLTFTPTDDNLSEGPETVVLSGNATDLAGDTATLTINDDDTPATGIELTLNPDTVSEDAASTAIEVTAALNGAAVTTATTVTVRRTGGTAMSGTDYAVVSDFTVTIPANQTSGTATLTFTPTDDSVHEGDETVVLRGAATGLAADTASLMITDDDSAPTGIGLRLDPASLTEDDGATPITVAAALVGSAVTSATAVTVSQTGGTAASGTDYAAVSSFTVTIPAGQTSGTVTLTFTPTDDNVSEGAETVVLTGSATGLAAGTATLTINDDDSPSTGFELSLNPDNVTEDGGAKAVTVTAALNAAARTTATTVTVRRTGGTATTGTDYNAVSDFTVTIPANQTSGTATLTFTPTDDSVFEGAETVVLTGNAMGLTGDTATLTITDDDIASTAIELSLDPASVREDGGAQPVTVTAALDEAARTTATTVTVSRTGGSATSGTDYAAVSDFTVTIPASQTSGTATLTFTPMDDGAAEGNETVVLRGNATGLTAGEATLTISDDDTPSTAIELSLGRDSVAEDAGATAVTVTAALNGAARTTATTVTVSRTGGTATSGTDYAAVSGFTVTIPANQTSGTATLTFTPTDDNVHEGDETVVLRGTAAGLTADAAALTIADDDPAPTAIELSLNPDSVAEDAAATPVTVTASLVGSAVTTATTVTVSRTGGTAISGTDYTGVSSFTVTIPARQASGTETLTFRPTDDNLAEGDETVVLSGSATGLTAGTATLTIDDDDTPSTAIELSLVPDSVRENSGSRSVRVTAELNKAARATATVVTVSRSGGTATPGTDYVAISEFTVIIPASQTSASETLTFTPTDDDLAEGAETVVLSGSASGLTGDTAILTITDDDPAPTAIRLSVAPTAVGEGAGATPVTVAASLVGSLRGEATAVEVSVAGSGRAGRVGFAPVSSFTVTIPAETRSGSGTFTLTPEEDLTSETDETVTVSGTTAVESIASVTAATLTLEDNDHPSEKVTLTVDPASVSESAATPVTVTGMLDGAARAQATTVRVSVTGSKGADAVDFGAVTPFDLVIPANQVRASATFTLSPVDDELDELDELIRVTGTTAGLDVIPAGLALTDDDPGPTGVTLSLAPKAVGEGAGATPVTVTATLVGSLRIEPTRVTVSVAGSGASGTVGFAPVSDFTVTIPAESRDGSATFTLRPEDDEITRPTRR